MSEAILACASQLTLANLGQQYRQSGPAVPPAPARDRSQAQRPPTTLPDAVPQVPIPRLVLAQNALILNAHAFPGQALAPDARASPGGWGQR